MPFILVMTKPDLSFLASCSFPPLSSPLFFAIYLCTTLRQGLRDVEGGRETDRDSEKEASAFNDMLCYCLTQDTAR